MGIYSEEYVAVLHEAADKVIDQQSSKVFHLKTMQNRQKCGK